MIRIKRVVIVDVDEQGAIFDPQPGEVDMLTLEMIVERMNMRRKLLRRGQVHFIYRDRLYIANFDPSLPTCKLTTEGQAVDAGVQHLEMEVAEQLVRQHGRPPLEKISVVFELRDDRPPEEIVAEADARWADVEQDLGHIATDPPCRVCKDGS